MASNSSSCKTWCITIVSAILVANADKKVPDNTVICFIPILLFFMLDTYYLALEKGFRNIYTSFVDKLHSHNLLSTDLYVIKLEDTTINLFIGSLKSFSIMPFYLILAIMVVIARSILN